MSKELRHLHAKDKKLGKIIKQVGPCQLVRRGEKVNRPKSPFLSLAKSICYQQLHGKAAATIWKRVLELPGSKAGFTPAWVKKATIKKLCSAGLSKSKAAAMKDLAEKTLSKTVPSSWKVLDKLTDEEIILRLTEVKGIGQWTVEMLLIFSMGRPDVLPANDYGVKNGFTKVYKKSEFPTSKELLEFGKRWSPYRSYAAWYLWRATEL